MAKAQSKTLLVVAAHPDDEVLGAGGMLAKRCRDGWKIKVIFLATGIASRYKGSAGVRNKVQKEISSLRRCATKALKVLGISLVRFMDFPDNRMDTVSRMDLAKGVAEEIRIFNPKVVLTHHRGDYNWDHSAVFDAVLMATRPNPPDPYPYELYSFEVLSATERAYQKGDDRFSPNYYEDIEGTIMLKKKAMANYSSEVRAYPHPRSIKSIDILARKRGMEVGLKYAEAFQLIRRIEI